MNGKHYQAVFAAAFIAGLAYAPAARADVRSEAREHFRAGMRLLGDGQLDEGVAELEAAYEILPHPNVLYNIARAYAEAGRFEDAIEYFEEYLASDPPDAETVRGFVAALERRVEARAATPATSDPDDTPEPEDTAAAAGDEVASLRQAAADLRALHETSGDPALLGRAEALEALAARLSDDADPVGEGVADASTASTDDDPEPESTESTPESPAGLDFEGRASSTDVYDERVVSSSRFAQNPLDAPNSTATITRQDIRLTGLSTIPELLRRIAGVHVATTSPANPEVGIRGFNQLLSSRVLVLINGRSTYTDPLASTFWAYMPVQVEDIERIEVIRGPASALYGANGFSGVVNIITRTPSDDAGTRARVEVGNGSFVRANLSTAGRSSGLGWRVGAGYTQRHRFGFLFDPERVDVSFPVDDPRLAQQTANANLLLDYRVRRNVQLYLDAGMGVGSTNFLATGTDRDFYVNGAWTHAMAGVRTDWGQARVFWNRYDATGDVAAEQPLSNDFTWNTVDAEIEFAREFELGVPHNLHIGGGYRLKTIEWNQFAEDQTEHHWRLFFQDSMQLADWLILVASYRVDRHPLLTDFAHSPRGALVFRPSEKDAIRASVSTAFRTPAMLETYIFNQQNTSVSGVGVLGAGSEVRGDIFGDPPIDAESILSAELGYSRQDDDNRFSLEANVYYNRVRDLIQIRPDTTEFGFSDWVSTPIATFDREEGVYPFGVAGFVNDQGTFHVVGGEAQIRLFPVRGLDLYANYAYNQTFVRGNSLQEIEERTSRHMVNGGFQYRSTFGLDIAADVHYASPQQWPEQVTVGDRLVTSQFALDAFTIINGRIGYRFLEDDALDIGLAVYNLGGFFDGGSILEPQRQHPFAPPVEGRFMVSAGYEF